MVIIIFRISVAIWGRPPIVRQKHQNDHRVNLCSSRLIVAVPFSLTSQSLPRQALQSQSIPVKFHQYLGTWFSLQKSLGVYGMFSPSIYENHQRPSLYQHTHSFSMVEPCWIPAVDVKLQLVCGIPWKWSASRITQDNQNLPHEIGSPGVSGIPILEQPMRRSVTLPGPQPSACERQDPGHLCPPCPGPANGRKSVNDANPAESIWILSKSNLEIPNIRENPWASPLFGQKNQLQVMNRCQILLVLQQTWCPLIRPLWAARTGCVLARWNFMELPRRWTCHMTSCRLTRIGFAHVLTFGYCLNWGIGKLACCIHRHC